MFARSTVGKINRSIRLAPTVWTEGRYHCQNYPVQQTLIKAEHPHNKVKITNIWIRNFAASIESDTDPNHLVDSVTYERVCSETLETLCEYFEDITEQADNLRNCDVAYSDGVLTIKFGSKYGTYVINRQTPNRQIWLSSPTSGPKRYDYVAPNSGDNGKWVYKHTGETMHELLQKEIEKIVEIKKVDFYKLPYSA